MYNLRLKVKTGNTVSLNGKVNENSTLHNLKTHITNATSIPLEAIKILSGELH